MLVSSANTGTMPHTSKGKNEGKELRVRTTGKSKGKTDVTLYRSRPAIISCLASASGRE